MGVTTVAEGAQRYHGTNKLFSSVSMNLREWSSNSSHLISQLPAHDVASGPTVKMLGLKWHLPSDSFYIPDSTPLQLQQVLTRRSALHTIASIYDPLGMFTPVTFHGKIFLRTLWQAGGLWDAPLPGPVADQWHTTAQLLKPLSTVNIRRYVGPINSATACQLHIFCDASKDSYGAAVYLRAAQPEDVAVNLLYSKCAWLPLEP